MSKNLLISDISVTTTDEANELSGYVDGERIYFRAPRQFALYPKAEWFIGIALLEAMISNRALEVDASASISRQLHESLGEIQAIYSCWNNDLSIVSIAAGISDQEVQPNESVGVFFSAGIDSSFSLLQHLEEITHLIMFRSFDSGNDSDSWAVRVERQSEFARELGKTLITIETNARQWTDEHKISWEFAHGLFLSSAGSALGMRKIYVPSSHTYDELFPWGSHPLSDPMWSTESTEVIHDGAGHRRGAKTRFLMSNQQLADNLQVCWRSTHTNCGECPKCVRSMVAIHLLGAKTSSLPEFKDLNMLKQLKAVDESGATFLEDGMLLAKQSNNEKIYKILRGYYRNYQASQVLPLIDRNLLGGLVSRTYRKLNKPDWRNWRVTLRGANRWTL